MALHSATVSPRSGARFWCSSAQNNNVAGRAALADAGSLTPRQDRGIQPPLEIRLQGYSSIRGVWLRRGIPSCFLAQMLRKAIPVDAFAAEEWVLMEAERKRRQSLYGAYSRQQLFSIVKSYISEKKAIMPMQLDV